MGIEINEYAAELARATVWIGEIQWRKQHGYGWKENPILDPLDQIECRDAVLNGNIEATWPRADGVVGNPPFLGTKKQWAELGVDYSTRLRAAYKGRVPGFADLVCYWFERARNDIALGNIQRAGFVATNSIRGGANRQVLDGIAKSAKIVEAWSDLPWVNEGAAVRVSLIAFGRESQPGQPVLDGRQVASINPDLTSGSDISKAGRLEENLDASFMATVKAGSFDIPMDVAHSWLRLPNASRRSNEHVVKRWANAMDVVRRPSGTWVVDFGISMTQEEAMLYEAPYAYVQDKVLPERLKSNRKAYRERWWLMAEPTPKMRSRLAGLPRYIATPVIAKHRLFVWLDSTVLPDHALIVTARQDDTTFGILHSRMHELWSLRLGTALEDRPRYTPTTTFETFPFPDGLTPRDTDGLKIEQLPRGEVIPAALSGVSRTRAVAIARAAHRLTSLRDAWLNPAEWTERLPEVVPLGKSKSPYPNRIVAKPGHETEVAKRTLTNLYNQRPAWLVKAHQELDGAVATAFGWTDYTPSMREDEILQRLLHLNQERTEHQPVPAQRDLFTRVVGIQPSLTKRPRRPAARAEQINEGTVRRRRTV